MKSMVAASAMEFITTVETANCKADKLLCSSVFAAISVSVVLVRGQRVC